MKNSARFLTLAFLSLALAACSSVANLGIIELAPDVPKRIKVGDANWTFTAKRDAGGKQRITAESAGHKVTKADIASSAVSPDATIGSTITEQIDLTDVPAGREVTGYFGGTLSRFTLKYDAN